MSRRRRVTDLVPVDPRRVERAGFAGLPAIIAKSGPKATESVLEYFLGTIRNRNTRRAYANAVRDFLAWSEQRGLDELGTLRPLHVAAYVEQLTDLRSAPTVKQHLAAIRMLLDHLVRAQVIEVNPAAAVRGPKHVVRRGKTPVLSPEETRELLDSIDTTTVAGLRDRALIGTLVYSFARIGAALRMDVEDYYAQGKRWWLRLHEKGGKRHEVPVHHSLEQYLDAYLDGARIRHDEEGPLFRTLSRELRRPLSRTRLQQAEAWVMIRRRAKAAGIRTKIGSHTFRATGITAYLLNGGSLEHAQQIAAHESPRTTKLYDRTRDEITLDEIERIQI